jgi:ring-1,2-phenylacetyl-CoA epoxidase subunit PaaD
VTGADASVGRGGDLDVIRAAVSGVDDPEMPGVSIVDLGLLETVEWGAQGDVVIGLVPTFSGCPALGVIAEDVRRAVACVEGVTTVAVEFLRAPAWSVDRVSRLGQDALRAHLGVAVARDGVAICPRCGTVTQERSLFGPTRCRAIHACPGCGDAVEVMR